MARVEYKGGHGFTWRLDVGEFRGGSAVSAADFIRRCDQITDLDHDEASFENYLSGFGVVIS